MDEQRGTVPCWDEEDEEVDEEEVDPWAAQAINVRAWLSQWDAWSPDDGRPRAAFQAAQEYHRNQTPEAQERLLTAQAECQAASQVPVQAYWVRRVHMRGAEVAFQVAKAVEYLCGMLLGTGTVAKVQWHLKLAARALQRDRYIAARQAQWGGQAKQVAEAPE